MVTREEKVGFTQAVKNLEVVWRAYPAQSVRQSVETLREALMRKGRWDDTSWVPPHFDSQPSLLERLNRIQRLNIVRERPDAIAPSAMDRKTGAARQDSPLRAGADTFATEVKKRADEMASTGYRDLYRLALVGIVVYVGVKALR